MRTSIYHKGFAIAILGLALGSCSLLKRSGTKDHSKWTKRDSVAFTFGKLNGDGFRKSMVHLPDDSLSKERILEGFRYAFMQKSSDSLHLEEAKLFLNNYFKELEQKRNEQIKLKNDSILKVNQTRQGVKVTESGLQYRVLRPSKGVRPTVQDTVVVHYKGMTIDGKEFDNSYKRKQPAVFSVLDVIPGWTEGLCLMNKGAKYEFYIPAKLAYENRGAGEKIPPHATLIFEIELLDVKPYIETEMDKKNVIVLDKNGHEVKK